MAKKKALLAVKKKAVLVFAGLAGGATSQVTSPLCYDTFKSTSSLYQTMRSCSTHLCLMAMPIAQP